MVINVVYKGDSMKIVKRAIVIRDKDENDSVKILELSLCETFNDCINYYEESYIVRLVNADLEKGLRLSCKKA